MMIRGLASLIVCLSAIASLAASTTPTSAADGDASFSVSIDSPTVKLGQTASIVATISARGAYRITESYRHRITNLSSADGGVEIARKVVRGSVKDGTVVFRVDVQPTTPGPHVVVGVFRFSINNGEQLDIKAAPFEATITATE